MKIHLITNMYPSKSAPNYGVFVKNTEDILREAGFYIDRTALQKENNKLKKLLKYMFYYLKILFKGLTRKYDITYVHYAAHNAFPVLLLKRMKKNMFICTNVHGSDVVPEVPSQEKYQKAVKKLLEESDIIIAPSNYYKTLIREKYGINNRIEVFPSGGVNRQIFYARKDKRNVLEELQLNGDYRYIGYVSRLDIGKGWDVFLKSLKKLHDENYLENSRLRVIVVGDGKDKNKFLEMIKSFELEQHIIHYPLLPQRELNTIYNAIDVLCFPTTRKGESLGLVGLEAMACGTPVIGSTMGGLLDYIEDGVNGFLFQPGSEEDLASKIKRYFSLTDVEREHMSDAAKRTAHRYDTELIKPQLINIFHSIRDTKWLRDDQP